MADRRTADDAAALRYDARTISDGSAQPEAAIALSWTMLSNTTAQPYDLRNGNPAALESTRHAIDLAHRVGDAILESAALDEVIAVHLAVDDIPRSYVGPGPRALPGARSAIASDGGPNAPTDQFGTDRPDINEVAPRPPRDGVEAPLASHHSERAHRTPLHKRSRTLTCRPPT